MNRWWSVRRAGSIAAVAVPVLVASLALMQPGFPVVRLDLDDGGVWVTSAANLEMARFNVPVAELDGALTAVSTQLDVLQDGADVLLVEPGTVSVVDPAAVASVGTVSVPAQGQVGLGGGTVVVTDEQGQVWVRKLAQLTGLDIAVTADEQLGAGGFAVATVNGLVVGARPDGTLVELGRDGDVTNSREAGAFANGLTGIDQMTAVGNEPVVLDGHTVFTRAGAVSLDGSDLRLQQPGPAAQTVLVSSSNALFEVPLDGSAPVAHPTGSAGAPAAPVRVGDCVYAAWAASAGNWMQICGGEVSTTDRVDITATDSLRFRVNRAHVVLNDQDAGRVWLVEDSQVQTPDWEEVAPESSQDPDTDNGEDSTQALSQTCAQEGQEPVANDDDYGARAGRSIILPVLRNDSTSDCGILVITEVDEIPLPFGQVRAVQGGRALELEVKPGATGSVTFTYTVSDRPGERLPATATVKVTVHAATVNSPPVQVTVPSVEVAQGGVTSSDVLSSFLDPDGDPLVLVGATLDPTLGSVGYRPDGVVIVTAAGAVGAASANVMVTDTTTQTATVGHLDVAIREGALPPLVDPIYLTGLVGQMVEIQPLAAVHSTGSETVHLAAVGEVPGAVLTVDLERGTFTVTSTRPDTFYINFTVVGDGQQTLGWVRLDVVEPPSQALPPLAVADVAYLPAGQSVTVDPLANDSDPNGSVLAIQSVEPAAGLRAATVDHKLVEIFAVQTPSTPVTVTYQVSNGTEVSTGLITVVPVPPSNENQAPVVQNQEVTVRTGGVVTVDVLAAALDPDGDELSVVRELSTPLPDAEGLAFVSRDVLRYQAPQTAMTVTTAFQVIDSRGAVTAAQLTIHVHTTDAATKQAPRPESVVSRVFQGETLRIPIPLAGIDDDGDGVTLLGLGDEVPQRGLITTVGADYLEYRALAGEVGTDVFSYAVEDWTGQRAVGQITVGIVPRPAAVAEVVARPDAAVVAPGRTVVVEVLANDVDSAGDELQLDAEFTVVGDLGEGRVRQLDEAIEVVAPSAPAVIQIQYTVRNERGGHDSAVLTLTVDAQAPVVAPVARDVVVPATETIGRTQVDVDVLAAATNPSGPISELTVQVPAVAAQMATVTSNGRVRVFLGSHTQIVPYLLVNERDPHASAYAFITVPALGFFPPAPRPKAPELRVATGQSLEIVLDEQIQVAPGRNPTLADAKEIRASRGTANAVDKRTIDFQADEGYSGTASVTVKVTDATGPNDEQARTATITLVVTVYALEDHPPVFTASAVAVGAGETESVDLLVFLRTPEGDPAHSADYTFARSGAVPQGFSAALTGSVLEVSAKATAQRGAQGRIDLVISYGHAGSIEVSVPLRVVSSSRPLARVADRMIEDGHAGEARTIAVLDDAYNPFADVGGDLLIVDTAVETAGAGSISHTSSTVTLTPASDFLGSMVVRLTVADMTNDLLRHVEARITLVVSDVPAAPTTPRVVELQDSAVSLNWVAPAANGSAVRGYRVTVSPGGLTQECSATSCLVKGLQNGVSYTFTVAAHNDVGWSAESPASAPAKPDAVPDAPAAVELTAHDESVSAVWKAPHNHGSPIVSYQVEISPTPEDPNQPAVINASTTSTTIEGLANGHGYCVRVRALNASPQPGPWSAWSTTVVPATVPGPPLNLTATRVDTPAGGQIQVDWQTPPNNGSSLGSYNLTITGSDRDVTVHPTSSDTSYVMTGAANGVAYTFTLRATNAVGTSPAATARASTYGLPGRPTDLLVDPVRQSTSPLSYTHGVALISWRAPDSNGSQIDHYQVLVNGDEYTTTGTSLRVANLDGGAAVTAQVSACNLAGCGAAASAVSLQPPLTVPSAVSSLVIEVTQDAAGSPTLVYATWDVPDWAGDTGLYRVELLVDGVAVRSPELSSTKASFTDELPVLDEDNRTSATIGVRVTAVNSMGAGVSSHKVQTVSWLPPPEPVDITQWCWVPNRYGYLDAEWTQPPTAATYEWELHQGLVRKKIGTTELNSLHFDPAFFVNGSIYLQVRALDSLGRPSPWTRVQVYPS